MEVGLLRVETGKQEMQWAKKERKQVREEKRKAEWRDKKKVYLWRFEGRNEKREKALSVSNHFQFSGGDWVDMMCCGWILCTLSGYDVLWVDIMQGGICMGYVG